jgi:hypothetical protein
MGESRVSLGALVLVEAAPVDYFRPTPATPFTRRLKACRQATEKPAVVPRAKA